MAQKITNSAAQKRLETLRQKWGRSFIGEDGEGKDYTAAEIGELERIYTAQSAEFKGSITPKMEYTLQKLSKLDLEPQKALAEGDGQEAKRYGDMVKDLKKTEGLDAGEKPVEAFRPDALIVNLEKRGVVKEGKFFTKQGVIDYITNDKGCYTTCLDVVDEIMLLIENNRRKNSGESELDKLPKTLQVRDRRHELADGMSEDELDAMADLGLIPPQREE